jgi:uroporphyrinogen-III synthase
MTTAPLDGVRVVVTRARHQAENLCTLLQSAGAEVARLPLLEVVPPTDPRPLESAATELAMVRWLVLTSANSVHALLERAGGALPPALRIAVVGRRTAAALREYGIEPTLTAKESRSEGLAAILDPHLGRQERVLLPQAADAREGLAQKLVEAGAEVVRVVAYEKRTPDNAAALATTLFGDDELGWVTFTSPSIVRALVAVLGDAWTRARSSLQALSIGPVTTAELEKQGAPFVVEAETPSDEGLLRSLERARRDSQRREC